MILESCNTFCVTGIKKNNKKNPWLLFWKSQQEVVVAQTSDKDARNPVRDFPLFDILVDCREREETQYWKARNTAPVMSETYGRVTNFPFPCHTSYRQHSMILAGVPSSFITVFAYKLCLVPARQPVCHMFHLSTPVLYVFVFD